MVASPDIVSIAVTRRDLGLVVAIVLSVEGIRELFETIAEIRSAVRAKCEATEFAKAERRILNLVFATRYRTAARC